MDIRNKIIIIGNPVAGGGALAKIRKAEGILKRRGYDVELQLTSQKGDAESFAREAAALSGIMVIAAGGDGTYNEVANGLLHSSTPLAILPLGTTSVLAREFGIPLDTERALESALSGRIETVHLGRITCHKIAAPSSRNVQQGISSQITRHFLLMAGIGYDADAVYGVNEKVKKYSGKLAYILSGIAAIMNYSPGPLTLKATVGNQADIEGGRFRVHPDYCSVSGNILKSTGYIVIASNASCYGGNFKIAPDASLTSPYVYVFATHNKGKVDLIRYLTAIISGKTLNLRDISYFRTAEMTIEGNSHIQLDGDYAGTTPAKIDVVQNALKLVVPGR